MLYFCQYLLSSYLILTLNGLRVDDSVIKGSRFELRQVLAFVKMQRKIAINPKGCDTLYLPGGFRRCFQAIEIISVDTPEDGEEDITKNIATRYQIIVARAHAKMNWSWVIFNISSPFAEMHSEKLSSAFSKLLSKMVVHSKDQDLFFPKVKRPRFIHLREQVVLICTIPIIYYFL